MSENRITLEDVNEQLRPIYAKQPTIPGGLLRNPIGRWLVTVPMRFLPANRSGVSISMIRTGSIRSRIYRPDGGVRSAAALLWIHGGGFVLGTPAMNDDLCCEVARRLGVLVVSPDYRLAPKHPFPTPVDDCQEAWDWLVSHVSEHGVGPTSIAVGGQSAGGGLAAMLALRLRATGSQQLSAQWLFCPMLDDRTAARREFDDRNHYGWDNQSNAVGWHAFLGAEPGAPSVPALSVPAREKFLGGLPASWIGVGSIDLFHDEDLAYGEGLRAAGVPTTVEVVPGAPHGFEQSGGKTTLVREYIDTAIRWLTETLHVVQ